MQSSESPTFSLGKGRATGKRADGVRYERKAQDFLTEVFADMYLRSPWFCFESSERRGRLWCQPDGLVIDPFARRIVVVEFKLKHTSDAWWQVRKLYIPVVACAYAGDWSFVALSVVKWFDPSTPFPERVSMRADVRDLHPEHFNVHIWAN